MLKSVLTSSVALNIELQERGVFVAISAGQLHQMLLNLCTNAKAAMPEGGNLTIRLSVIDIDTEIEGPDTLTAGRYAEICFEDDGIGMDDNTLQHAFDPFFSTKEGNRRSGLGLASVYGISMNAGGSARIASTPGAGTRVTLRLPITSEAAPLREVRLDAAPDAKQGQNQTVLLVEDNISVQTLLQRLLEDAGYTVEHARNGREALEIAKTLEPDLLITDVVLSGPTGIQVAARLRASFPYLKVLYISAYADSHGGEWQELEQGQLLAKPFRSSELLAAVHYLLRPNNQDGRGKLRRQTTPANSERDTEPA